MKKRRLFPSLLALVLAAALLTSSAFAAEWFLEDGDITITADANGQTVSQGGTATADDAPVIRQRNNTTATDSTVTIETKDNATANVTIDSVNINSRSESSIEVGDSSAEITFTGDSTLSSNGTESTIHVSSGDLTITGDGSLKVDQVLNNSSKSEAAKIGSNAGEDMSGSIHITGNADVTVAGRMYFGATCGNATRPGAGIGSGYGSDMSGDITIDGSATVNVTDFYATSGNATGYKPNGDAAGIGAGTRDRSSGKGGNVTGSGTITIGGNASVNAASGGGAGIGSADGGDMNGTITIGENADVTASSGYGAGIGSGVSGSVGSTGVISIGGKAGVTAASGNGPAVGAVRNILTENGGVQGVICISGSAEVFLCHSESDLVPALGAGSLTGLEGVILILGSARVSTGNLSQINYDKTTGKALPSVSPGKALPIGGKVPSGDILISEGVTINGVSGTDTGALKALLVDADKEYPYITISQSETGEYTVTSGDTGVVRVGDVLYGESAGYPSAPGSYDVACVLSVRTADGTWRDIAIPLDTLVIPDSETPEAPAAEPLYRVTDGEDRGIRHTAEEKDGVLTITADAGTAVLTGRLSGIRTLKTQGITEIRFVTNGAESRFLTEELLAQGQSGDIYKLLHENADVRFILGTEETDLSFLLQK